MTKTTAPYVPGVCNINPAETAYRRKAGWAGLAITVLIALPLVLLDVNRFVRLIIWLPAFLSATSFLQAHYRFCVAYAASGLQNAAGDRLDTAAKVSVADRLKDKAKANRIYLQAAAIAVAVTAVLVALP